MAHEGVEFFYYLAVNQSVVKVDNGTIIYIILAIVFFIINAFFRKKEPEGGQEAADEQNEQPRKPASFEDLLKEIRQEQEGREKDLQHTGQQQAKPEEEEIAPAYESEEEKVVPERQQPEAKYYEGTFQSQQKESKKTPLVKLDDQVDLEADEKILGEVEDIAGDQPYASKYKKLLRNQDSLKDAVVVSEILNRKRF